MNCTNNLASSKEVAKKLKVLQIITRVNVGGPALFLFTIANNLQKEGFDIQIIAGKQGKYEGNMARLLGIELAITYISSLQRSITPLDLLAFIQLYRIIKSAQPDIVHTHMSKAGVLARLAAYLAGTPILIHTFHGHIFHGYFSKPKTMFFVLVERLLASITTVVIALTKSQKDTLAKLYKITTEDKIKLIPIGVDLNKYLDCKQRYRGKLHSYLKLDKSCKIVGTVTRLVAIKGVETFIEAAAQVQKNIDNVEFVIVGDGELRKSLQNLGKRLGVRLHFFGFVKDLEEIYADLDVFVLASHNEGLPIALLEAASAGVPIVATAVGGILDIFTHRVNSLLVPPRNPQELANAINTLLSSHQLAQNYATAAKKTVYPHFDIHTVQKNIISLYQQLYEKKSHHKKEKNI